MCGRSRQCFSAAGLHAEAVRAGMPSSRPWEGKERYQPQQNMCPGKEAAVLQLGQCGELSLTQMRWGLAPSLGTAAKADHWRMFNARVETVGTLQVFSRLLKSRRCAVPLNGFFEWSDDEFRHGGIHQKQPWYVHACEDKPMWVAGVYTKCDDRATGGKLRSFTLLTMASATPLAWLHDRMPVILDEAGLKKWLDGDNPEPLTALRDGLLPASQLAWHPVTKKMSRLDYEQPDCALPIKLVSQQQRSVTSFFSPRSAKNEVAPGCETEEKKEPPTSTELKEALAYSSPDAKPRSSVGTSSSIERRPDLPATRAFDIRSFFVASNVATPKCVEPSCPRCPVCKQSVDGGNAELNRHLDMCLNKECDLASQQNLDAKKQRLA
ncbi:hypothetical protein AB1Y20_015364 [Prymnesium parvum]|uniref:UBZ4-type domain-containing protein n=1 Tax=Prymnesium parvum TaxID=97485 RepID=A0AB34K165_PRYPA